MKFKNRLLIVGAIILALIVLQKTGNINKFALWSVFPQNGENSFTIRLPDGPTKGSVPLMIGSQKTTLYSGQVNFNETSYIIGYAALPSSAQPNVSDEDILRQNLIPMERDGYTKLIEDTTPFEGYPSIYSSWSSPDGAYKMISQNVLTKTHLYRLVTSTPSAHLENEQEDIMHFFESFELKDIR